MNKVQKVNRALKERRENSGFTQIQIAEKVGISERCYQRYESGERCPDIYLGQLIAHALGCYVSQIFPLQDGNPAG